MAHWRYLAESFLAVRGDIDGILVSYEDLVGQTRVLLDLEKYLGISLDRTVLSHQVGSQSDKSAKPSWRTRLICAWMTRKTCRALENEPTHPVHHQITSRQTTVEQRIEALNG
jgi:hypothetical protein